MTSFVRPFSVDRMSPLPSAAPLLDASRSAATDDFHEAAIRVAHFLSAVLHPSRLGERLVYKRNRLS